MGPENRHRSVNGYQAKGQARALAIDTQPAPSSVAGGDADLAVMRFGAVMVTNRTILVDFVAATLDEVLGWQELIARGLPNRLYTIRRLNS